MRRREGVVWVWLFLGCGSGGGVSKLSATCSCQRRGRGNFYFKVLWSYLFACFRFLYRADCLTLPFQAIECYLANVVPLQGLFYSVVSVVVVVVVVVSVVMASVSEISASFCGFEERRRIIDAGKGSEPQQLEQSRDLSCGRIYSWITCNTCLS